MWEYEVTTDAERMFFTAANHEIGKSGSLHIFADDRNTLIASFRPDGWKHFVRRKVAE